MNREPKVELDHGDLRMKRYSDGMVWIDAPGEEPILIHDLQAYIVATFIFGTDSEREPYCCSEPRKLNDGNT